MIIRWDTKTETYTIEKSDFIGNHAVKELILNDERKEIFYNWASKQIDLINERKLRSVTGAFSNLFLFLLLLAQN